MATVSELKQSCLDLSKSALELYDRFEEHGLEAAWEGDGALVVVRMSDAHEVLRQFLLTQSTLRLLALGVSPADLLRRS